MPYNLYLTDNNITPFITVNDGTIDTSTSIPFIGRTKINYGQSQDQGALWLLENFSNGTPPSAPLVGQLWYDRPNDSLKVWTTLSTWEVVGAPVANATGPSSPDIGNLWFDTVNNVLKAWNGSVWVIIGPSQQLAPISVYEQDYSTNITNDGTSTELWKNGIIGTRLVIPSNTTWVFEMQIAARRTDAGVEYGGWKIKGVINNTSGNVTFAATPALETYGNSAITAGPTITPLAWNVSVTADNTHSSLDIFVTGQVGKVIDWTCVSEITKVQ